MTSIRRAWPLVAFAALTGLLLGALQPGASTGFGRAVEGWSLDLRFALRGPLASPDGVAVVLIDDRDIAALGEFPPPRAALADAVRAIDARGAAGIALDLLLLGPRDGDPALAAALAGIVPTPVLAVARGDGPDGAPPAAAPDLTRSGFDVLVDMPDLFAAVPRAPVASLAAASVMGHANVVLEPDGALRRIPAGRRLMGEDGETWVPALALSAVRQAVPERFAPLILRGRGADGAPGSAVQTPAAAIPLDRFGAVPLVYHGPRGTVPTWPLRDVAVADLAGRVVFLGIDVAGAGDRHATPFDPMLPGVEAQATLAANLLDGRHLRRDPATWAIDLTIAPVLAVLTVLAAGLAPPVTGPLLAAGVWGAAAGGLQWAFVSGLWLDGATALAALTLGTGTGMAVRTIRGTRRAANLGRYQSPLMVDALADAARPGFDGRAQQAAAVFVDLAGYTALAQRAGPDGAVALLRRFHDAVAECAARHRGVVEGFAGDGAMVIFGLPEPRPGDAAAALDFVGDIRATTTGIAPVRIGAHWGRVRATVAGAARHRHVTIAGDVVNTASRLQGVAKDQGHAVVLSDALLQQDGDPAARTAALGLRDIGLHELRGRDGHVHLWGDGGRPE
ncbi:adenylate/guanylate cyclase domain-containing protein [Jannaschia sp. LMIT008]|uniref:CHASE2 domain-containing protein n=1 Tax=Jannaschia maritima TaxID=3032585 RepID=UPI002810F4CF|nr:adenylate/guanylate cyclase domain-containing protein [Jannaschia sp. LMIT008]